MWPRILEAAMDILCFWRGALLPEHHAFCDLQLWKASFFVLIFLFHCSSSLEQALKSFCCAYENFRLFRPLTKGGPTFKSNIMSSFRPGNISKSKNAWKHGIKRHQSLLYRKNIRKISQQCQFCSEGFLNTISRKITHNFRTQRPIAIS